MAMARKPTGVFEGTRWAPFLVSFLLSLIYYFLYSLLILFARSFFIFTIVCERILAEKLMKAEKKVYSTFFAEGAHSLDSTGEQSEADFPF
jgi:hypothetical protein